MRRFAPRGARGAHAAAPRAAASRHCADIELWAINPPGRGSRLAEPPALSVLEMASAIADALAPHTLKSFAFFGHSLGAAVAFDTARALAARSLHLPLLLFASSHLPPGAPAREDERLSHLPDEELVAGMKRIGWAAQLDWAALAADAELRGAVLPALRADLLCNETWAAAGAGGAGGDDVARRDGCALDDASIGVPFDEPKRSYYVHVLPVPIIPLGGSVDESVPLGALDGWLRVGAAAAPYAVDGDSGLPLARADAAPPTAGSSSCGSLRTLCFDGGHFYLHGAAAGARGAVLAAIVAHVRAAHGALPEATLDGGAYTPWRASVFERFAAQAARRPRRVAMADDSRALTFGAALEEVETLATALAGPRIGLTPGSIVALLLHADVSYMIAQLAAARVGCGIFPLQTNWAAETIAQLLEDVRPPVLLVAPALVDRLRACALPAGTAVFDLGVGWRDALTAAAAAEAWAAPPREWASASVGETTSIITMTSGSTGRPKGILCPYQALELGFEARYGTLPYAEAGPAAGGPAVGGPAVGGPAVDASAAAEAAAEACTVETAAGSAACTVETAAGSAACTVETVAGSEACTVETVAGSEACALPCASGLCTDEYGVLEREACSVMFPWEALRAPLAGHCTVCIAERTLLEPELLLGALAARRISRILTTPSLLTTLVNSVAPRFRALAAARALRVW